MRRAALLLVLSACGDPVQPIVSSDAGPTVMPQGGGDAGPGDAGIWSPPDVTNERSLAWTHAALVEDPTVIGLARLMSTMCPAQAPGRVFESWLRAFSTTAHSERAGPALLADELAQAHGSDAATWPLDEVPFIVTAIHNRIDLSNAEHCGEFRVSMASAHPLYRPLHFIWLYRLNGPDCAAEARRWAGLSALAEAEFLVAARALIDEHIRADHFLIAESVEFTVSPWEWRQWTFSTENSVCTIDNPPLFQQIDRESLNMTGTLRDEFLAFVDGNAAALNARTLALPERFRPKSSRANQGVPWTPLSLEGVSPTTLSAYPDLRRNIEIVGCTACHFADAPFVQTGEDRMFSPFYRKELDARRQHLIRLGHGERPSVPFGPLQPNPTLTP